LRTGGFAAGRARFRFAAEHSLEPAAQAARRETLVDVAFRGRLGGFDSILIGCFSPQDRAAVHANNLVTSARVFLVTLLQVWWRVT